MFYKEIESLAEEKFKRLTDVKKDVFTLMLGVVENYKSTARKLPSRGGPVKLSNEISYY